MIEIVAYREDWLREFRREAARLRTALGDLALRIDHIGSTSVPGLAAKDVIDIQITVASLEPAEPLRTAFQRAGFELRPAIFEDHRPPGDRRPEAEWQKRMAVAPADGRRIHTHIRVEGRANQRYPLLFRDFLRADPLARGGYEAVKRELARLHPDDIDAYYAVKDPVCDIIMAGAERWAVATDWRPGPTDV